MSDMTVGQSLAYLESVADADPLMGEIAARLRKAIQLLERHLKLYEASDGLVTHLELRKQNRELRANYATGTAALRKVRDEMAEWNTEHRFDGWLAALDAIIKERE